ncbi:LIM and senescent cell antigen-like-containing domain protein 1 [Grus japonensis]|uniref:LIM and senescent cell antigen-like-containing domain protein 1 n=1 Tax=Grus japonensis TaxID=30415 RepID=A0ABC9W1E5_GRUJA
MLGVAAAAGMTCNSNMANALANAICERCRGGFAPAEKIVNSNGELYHEQCFVCAQCFQQFPEGLFYEDQKTFQCCRDTVAQIVVNEPIVFHKTSKGELQGSSN